LEIFFDFSLDRFFKAGIFDKKKGHQPDEFGGSGLMAWKAPKEEPLWNRFVFLSYLPEKINADVIGKDMIEKDNRYHQKNR